MMSSSNLLLRLWYPVRTAVPAPPASIVLAARRCLGGAAAQQSVYHPPIRRLNEPLSALPKTATTPVDIRKGDQGTPRPTIELFQLVDSDNDGLINKHQFQTALELLRSENRIKNQEAAKNELVRLTKKLDTIQKLEQHMASLEAEIDTVDVNKKMFTITKEQTDDIKGMLAELKSLVHGARAVFNTAATTTR
jgi:hypothetical protein